MIRRILWIVVLLAAIGVAALYLPLDFLRPSVERALERGLARKVDVGHVYLNLFGVPGFTFEDVTIHEDPRAGIEPFAYVPSLNAGIRVLSLFRHRLVVSSLNLGGATVNIVKTNGDLWNFQLLPQQLASGNTLPPAIKMRGGRVNFKFGEIKSVFYFNDADLDVTPYGHGSMELRFGGAPSRTDRTVPDFGHFFVRGNWTPGSTPRLDAQVELERGPLDEISRLIDPRGFGVQGFVSLRTQLSGPPSALQIAGELQVEDVHRWDLLPQPGNWRLPLKGTLDLGSQKIDMATIDEADIPLAIEFRGSDFLARLQWEARAKVQRVPLAALIEIAKRMGGEFPEKLTADGAVSGELSFSQPGGIAGQLELRDASLTLPDGKPLRASSASVSIREGDLYLDSATVEIGEKESAELQADYRLEEPRGLDLRIATRGMNVTDMQSFGLASIPLLDQTSQGTWRGWARYRSGDWTGEYELQNARIVLDGLADPLRIQSASVKLSGKRVIVSRLHGRAGKIAFTGDYAWEPDAMRPHKFDLEVPEADASELARLFAPTLAREQGFFARTLRLAPSSAPEWLKGRRADGAISIGVLHVGDTSVRLDTARILWDRTLVRLAGLDAHVLDGDTDQAGIAGDLQLGLEHGAPHFQFDGSIGEVPFKGGAFDFEGTLSADGLGSQIFETMRAEGRVRGRSFSLAPDSEFRTARACFTLFGSSNGPTWKFGEVEAVQGTDTYTGSGSLPSDGKLVLDLSRSGRPVRAAAAP